MKIPFGYPQIDNIEKKLVNKILSGPILAHGPYVKKFEENFAKFTGAPYSISVSSCTAGMHLFFFCLGIKKGSEVIVSSQTHVATAHAIELSGAKPIFVDAEENNGNIDTQKIVKAINSKTIAISINHLNGIPANMLEVMKIANKFKLKVLEDCATSLGAKINQKHVGLFGDAGVFSFYPVKHITTGEGGMIITKNKNLAKKLKYAKAFGVDKSFSERKVNGLYNCISLGLNYRMNEISGAIGISQIKKFPKFLASRKKNFFFLSGLIDNNENFKIVKPLKKNFKNSLYALNIILENKIKLYRNEIILMLKKKNIITSIYYPHPVPRLTYYKKKYNYSKNKFLNAEKFSDSSICFPIAPHVNNKMMKYMAETLNQVIFKIIRKYKIK